MRYLMSLLLVCYAAGALALTDRESLEKWCRQNSSVGAARCLAYLLATEDALASDSIEGVRACLPREITLQEQYRIVTTWLAANPDASAATAMGLVARAYATHYPCAK